MSYGPLKRSIIISRDNTFQAIPWGRVAVGQRPPQPPQLLSHTDLLSSGAGMYPLLTYDLLL